MQKSCLFLQIFYKVKQDFNGYELNVSLMDIQYIKH